MSNGRIKEIDAEYQRNLAELIEQLDENSDINATHRLVANYPGQEIKFRNRQIKMIIDRIETCVFDMNEEIKPFDAKDFHALPIGFDIYP